MTVDSGVSIRAELKDVVSGLVVTEESGGWELRASPVVVRIAGMLVERSL